jgi:hypothetical protein
MRNILGRKGIEPSIAMLLSLQLNPSYQQTVPSFKFPREKIEFSFSTYEIVVLTI